jgi:hypothetical protein
LIASAFVGTWLNHAISQDRSTPLESNNEDTYQNRSKVSSLTAAEVNSAYRTEENP